VEEGKGGGQEPSVTGQGSIVSSTGFFNLWVKACKDRDDILSPDLSNAASFTAHVLTDDDSVIGAIVKSLKLEFYCGYYSIDAFLFAENDRVPSAPENTNGFRDMRWLAVG
jgi:hypothetical protein